MLTRGLELAIEIAANGGGAIAIGVGVVAGLAALLFKSPS
jgi:hypothetical protein